MDLFSQELPAPARIVQMTSTPLSKDQKRFNELIKKIESKRARLAHWGTIIPLFKQKYVADLLPLQEQERDLQSRLAQALDAAHAQHNLTKGEKRKLGLMIVDLAKSVLEQTEHGELKRLYNKHSRSDFDAEEAASLEGMQTMIEDLLGVELGEEVNLRSPEDVLKRVENHYRTQHEQWQAKQTRRKKTAREQARKARLEGEEKLVSQSLREVYRKLASSLHPDREVDPAEKQRKTELMQRANFAYEKGNLLELLELQLRLEHIDRAHLAAINPERLKHYIKILKDQLSELDMEIQCVENEFSAEFGLSPFERQDPNALLRLLRADIATCEIRIRHLQVRLASIGDLKSLKAWLKTVSLGHQPDPDFNLPF